MFYYLQQPSKLSAINNWSLESNNSPPITALAQLIAIVPYMTVFHPSIEINTPSVIIVSIVICIYITAQIRSNHSGMCTVFSQSILSFIDSMRSSHVPKTVSQSLVCFP